LFHDDNAPATTATAAPANTIFDPFAPSTSNHVFFPGQPPIVPSAALQASAAAQQALDNMHSVVPASMAGGATGAHAPLLVRCVRWFPFCGSARAIRAHTIILSPILSPIRSPVIQTLMDLLRSLQTLRRDYNTRVIINSIHTVNKAVSMLRTNSNKAGHVDHHIAHVASAILVDFTASISFE
jgi:fructose-specific phosphotransferase system IIC component